MSVSFRFWAPLLAFCLVGSTLVSSPAAGAQGEEPERPVPVDVVPDDGLLAPGPPPVVVQAAGPGERRGIVAAVAEGSSAEAKRPGWKAQVVSAGLVRGGETEVGESPVRVDVSEQTQVSDVFVNVLDAGFASQLSPFSAAAVLGFTNPAGVDVVPGGPYGLSLDLSDVNLSDEASVQERLTITRYVNCELFEPDLKEVADENGDLGEIDGELVADVVVCDEAVELDAESIPKRVCSRRM